jgi:hypothetical protein
MRMRMNFKQSSWVGMGLKASQAEESTMQKPEGELEPDLSAGPICRSLFPCEHCVWIVGRRSEAGQRYKDGV